MSTECSDNQPCLSCLANQKFGEKIKYFLTVHHFVISTFPHCAYINTINKRLTRCINLKE